MLCSGRSAPANLPLAQRPRCGGQDQAAKAEHDAGHRKGEPDDDRGFIAIGLLAQPEAQRRQGETDRRSDQADADAAEVEPWIDHQLAGVDLLEMPEHPRQVIAGSARHR
jgi:hypothetical protein